MFLNNPFQILFLFSFKEDDFLPLTNVGRPVSKSGNCSNLVTARSIVVASKTFVSM